MLNVTEAWRATYPDAHAGLLVIENVENPSTHPELEREKHALEQRLRAQFVGQDRRALESYGVMPAYAAYYRRFDKTYHVQGQFASIAFKGKPIPSVAALVEAMFMAEVKNGLLTAGHDLDQLQLPLTLDIARGDEQYKLLRGQEQGLKARDMLIRDGAGVISSIIYGPDERTQITSVTRKAAFTVYAPGGIDAETVEAHLRDIRDYVRMVSPDAKVQSLQVIGARQ